VADPRPAAAPRPDAFFVYGTLRPGQPNFGRISRLVAEVEPAMLPHHVLYGHGLPFPYATPGAGRVVGDLLRIRPGWIEGALRILDLLEGYRGEGLRNHYERRAASVVTADGRQAAWVYLASASVLVRLTPDQALPSGDWCRRLPLSSGARRS
jgi:gamma-glutamylcyclotransferase (GGCT)/AIG2-like uncharacterized protein YtfP